MKLGVYSMFDKVSGVFQTPVFEVSEATAARNFRFAVKRNEFIGFAAADFDLYKIGEFDSESGELTSVNPITVLSGSVAKEE